MILSGRGGRPTGGWGVNPRWPSPRKESIKCKGGRRMQEDTGGYRTFLAETQKVV